MPIFLYPLLKNYEQQFGTLPEVDEKLASEEYSATSSRLLSSYMGREIWLPILFTDLDPTLFPATDYTAAGELLVPFASISVGMKKTWIKTPLSQRKGAVHELYNINDYQITIKGFLLDLKNRSFPEEQLLEMERLWSVESAVGLDNALTNIFLDDTDNGEGVFRPVVITHLSFPEVKGGKKHIRPFSMRVESDLIFTLMDES